LILRQSVDHRTDAINTGEKNAPGDPGALGEVRDFLDVLRHVMDLDRRVHDLFVDAQLVPD
jgi:hypothetical protein